MASSTTFTVLVVLSLGLMVTLATSQSCDDWTQLVPCQDVAADPGAEPSGECCSKLKEFQGKPDCLCSLLLSAESAAQSTGLAFNLQAVLAIPRKCNVPVPSGYNCGGITIPGN